MRKEKEITVTDTKRDAMVKTTMYETINGIEYQLGEPQAEVYYNSAVDRPRLLESESEDVVNSILAIWGDDITVVENK